MTTGDRDYIRIALKYAEDVSSGKIPACSWVRAAADRQIADLKREKEDPAFPFRFDRRRSSKRLPKGGRAFAVCKFIEKLPHIKGKWAKAHERIRLEPWQVFILTTVFGWYHGETKLRRFRQAYIELPRKNGKSTLSSGVGLYCLTMDQEEGAEIYSAATTRDQARIVWQDAKRMVDRLPDLRKIFGIDTTAHAIHRVQSASKFQALSAEGSTLDGLNVHCAIIDELHAHRKRTVYDVIETGTGARSQPLIWSITTAGSDRSGICYEQRIYVTKILSRVVHDETYFGIIYTIDENDDWTDPAIWEKANPNFNVSVFPDDIARLCAKAKRMTTAQSNFLTKRLSVWVNADTPLFHIGEWEKNVSPLTMDDFRGERAYVGIDLAQKHDFCALGILFKREDHFYYFCRHYLSEQEVEDSPNPSYQGWAKDGWIRTNPGTVTDYGALEDDLEALSRQFQIVQVGFDPFSAQQFSVRMVERGFPMVEVKVNVQNYSEPTKKCDALISEGKLHHDGNPVLAWEISNVVGHFDRKDNVFPTKERPENKIDGAMTLLTCLAGAILEQAAPEKDYQVFFVGG